MNDNAPRQHRPRLTQPGLLGSSAVMAAGTIVSRLTGFLRAMVIAAAIGLVGPTAEAFNLPNTIPNMIYILVAGGVLNAVLVPALVRAIKADSDGGLAYSQRLFSVVVVVLVTATILAVLLAPWLMRLFVDPAYLEPAHRAYFDNMVMFARFCLPQIFFYGMYVLIGQILNAHGRFGPMMWAPVVNNVVAMAVFGGYLIVAGQKAPVPFSDTETLYLGLGSTAGVALQAVVLVPVLRRTGFRIRFRTDWRGAGLGTAGKLGFWTLAFVIVNQIAYVLVIRTATAGSVAGEAGGPVYMNAMLIMMVPHAVITVSLATALLPRLADLAFDGHLETVRLRLVQALRATLTIMMPVAALLAALSDPLTKLMFDHGAATGQTSVVALTLVGMLPGLIAFTVHYVVLRGFYSMQDTRTPFFVQVWIAAAMIGNALVVGMVADPARITLLLGVGYSVAYVLGAVISLSVLGRRIGSLGGWSLTGMLVLLLVPAGLAGGAAFGLVQLLSGALDGLPESVAQIIILALAGSAGVAIFIAVAFGLRITEVRQAWGLARQRVGRRRRSAGLSMDVQRSDGDGAGGTEPPRPA